MGVVTALLGHCPQGDELDARQHGAEEKRKKMNGCSGGGIRAVDPHSIFADPDPTVLVQICNSLPCFLELKKT